MSTVLLLNYQPYDGSDITCNTRCGLYKNEPYFNEGISSTMQVLADWVIQSDKVITF